MAKIFDLSILSEKEYYFMGHEIEESYKKQTGHKPEPEITYQIIAFCEWNDDKELDAQLEIAYSQGYPVEDTYIMAAKNPDFLARFMFDELGPKIVYLFKNEEKYTFKIMRAVEALKLESHEFKWI